MAIYFQAVRGKSPTISGVYMLPSVLSQMCFAVGSGILGLSSLAPFSPSLNLYSLSPSLFRNGG